MSMKSAKHYFFLAVIGAMHLEAFVCFGFVRFCWEPFSVYIAPSP